MYCEIPSLKCEWVENDNGNFVGLAHGKSHVATVFNRGNGWQIIINGEDAVGRVVADEYFDAPEEAQERAGQILDGAGCTLVAMVPRDASTGWKTQKTISNGSPTYGRKHRGMGVSVKKAKSGKWYYVLHGADPQGWYDSAEDAMSAFDVQQS